MAREFKRTDRVGSQMQKELGELIRTRLESSRLGMITIQEVRVARDFSHAKVYFTTLGGQLDEKQTEKALKEAAPALRHELARRVRMRTIPQLHFVHDESVGRGASLSSLIEEAVARDSHKPE
ncbi:MAG: ribosome-binding factor A [Candidatus Sedimenticola endophacoides]|uniref:Ribosome-binding factor A n=1 Tax=Candidatus Sedimenticola endophacoides TaxID=2548426 RepID=A0A657Q290_9GAMM|nr:MAG: ribosome-binding factor A [Candidatus Sedimenticola endophacoides]OQX35427.1 MAG: ribosome-binding factor A [Candidatus Sedimenticola endophacoides]OQX40881.1 MAG: ribosome-binding factor A [Candidatus Sedimenticola endophacoides]OQX43936.1 MAG: ribosome-binding factor A [Candidatus Sedimenticola endophacoides]OQX44032.1 MAG: ribosome-binding factor A [Candidatus Sedimenticola endophacoides]